MGTEAVWGRSLRGASVLQELDPAFLLVRTARLAGGKTDSVRSGVDSVTSLVKKGYTNKFDLIRFDSAVMSHVG